MSTSMELKNNVTVRFNVDVACQVTWEDGNAYLHLTSVAEHVGEVKVWIHTSEQPVLFDGMTAFPVANGCCYGFDLSKSHGSDANSATHVIYEWPRAIDETVIVAFGDPPIWPCRPPEVDFSKLIGKVFLTTNKDDRTQSTKDRLKVLGLWGYVWPLMFYNWTAHDPNPDDHNQHTGPDWRPSKPHVGTEWTYYTHTVTGPNPSEWAIGPDGQPRKWGNHTVITDAARAAHMAADAEYLREEMKAPGFFHDVASCYDVPKKGGLTTTANGPRELCEIIALRNELLKSLEPCCGEGSFTHVAKDGWFPWQSLEMLWSMAGVQSSPNWSESPFEDGPFLVDYRWRMARHLRSDNSGVYRFFPKGFKPPLSRDEMDQLRAFCYGSARMMTLNYNGEIPDWMSERDLVREIIMGAVYHRTVMNRKLLDVAYYDGIDWTDWRTPSGMIRIMLEGATLYVNFGSQWSSVPELPTIRFGQHAVLLLSDVIVAGNVAIDRGPYFDLVWGGGVEMIDGRDAMMQWGWKHIPHGKLIYSSGGQSFETNSQNRMVTT